MTNQLTNKQSEDVMEYNPVISEVRKHVFKNDTSLVDLQGKNHYEDLVHDLESFISHLLEKQREDIEKDVEVILSNHQENEGKEPIRKDLYTYFKNFKLNYQLHKRKEV